MSAFKFTGGLVFAALFCVAGCATGEPPGRSAPPLSTDACVKFDCGGCGEARDYVPEDACTADFAPARDCPTAFAVCERQPDGACGYTVPDDTRDEMEECLEGGFLGEHERPIDGCAQQYNCCSEVGDFQSLEGATCLDWTNLTGLELHCTAELTVCARNDKGACAFEVSRATEIDICVTDLLDASEDGCAIGGGCGDICDEAAVVAGASYAPCSPADADRAACFEEYTVCGRDAEGECRFDWPTTIATLDPICAGVPEAE
jgi:hypothetical protein